MLPLQERVKLQNLLSGKYDAVFVESVRAFARRSTVVEALYEEAKAKKVQLECADMPGLFALDAPSTVLLLALLNDQHRNTGRKYSDTILTRHSEGIRLLCKPSGQQAIVFCFGILPSVQMALQTEKIIFELSMHFIADTDTDENYFGINFS